MQDLLGNDQITEFKINENFAKKFEFNKKRVELEQLKLKYENNSEESSSSSTSEEEDEDGELMTPMVDLKILKTIEMIKKGEIDDQFDLNKEIELKHLEKRKQQKMNLKDYHTRTLLNGDSTTLVDSSSAVVKSTLDEPDVDLKAFQVPANEDDDLFTIVKHEPDSYADYIKEELGPIANNDDDPEQQFLQNFVMNRGWKFDNDQKIDYNEIIDQEFEEKEEEYEIKHNFRFEEPESQFVIGHARDINTGVRRKDDKRTVARQLVKERKELEKEKKRQELKRLKNLKRKEIEEKLNVIRKNAGQDNLEFENFDLNEEFDPTKFDEQMNQVFNQDYYSQVELKKNGKKVKKPKFKDEIIENQVDESMEKKRLEKYMDEYFQLDYEDLIQDQPVRFKYTQVEPQDYSLELEEILLAPDEHLNELVSLKKMAPYRHPNLVEKDLNKWKRVGKSKLWEFRAKLKKSKKSEGGESKVEEDAQEKRKSTFKISKKKK